MEKERLKVRTLGMGSTEDGLGSLRVVDDDDGEEGATPLADDASILLVPALGELETLGTGLRDVERSIEPVLLRTRNEVCHGIVVPWKDKDLFLQHHHQFFFFLLKRCEVVAWGVLRA